MRIFARRTAARLLPTSVVRRIHEKRHPGVVGATMNGNTDEAHPERLLILPYVVGRTVEIGPGHRKTHQTVIGVDHVRTGEAGNVAGLSIELDVQAEGDRLPFRSGSIESLIARHNLEHYLDTAGTLIEWQRVLSPGGTLAVILPDEAGYPGRTVDLDPTHFHAFSRDSLARLCELVGFTVIRTDDGVEGWSFLLVARNDRLDATAG